jgi:hypothetical protein
VKLLDLYQQDEMHMNEETIKLGLIDRLMKVHEVATLKRMEKLIIQAEMEARAEKSLQAIEKGEVVTLKEFSNKNRKWLKKKYSK